MPRRIRRTRRGRHRGRRMPIVKLIKKVIKQSAEHKHDDFNVNTTDLVAVAPFSVGMNIIGTGDSVHGRIGNNISVSHVKFRYELNLIDANDAFSVRAYVIQFMDPDIPLDLPGIGDLFPTLDDSKQAYRILYDRTHEFALGIHRNTFTSVRISGKKLIELKFEDTNGTTPLMGNLFLQFVTNNIETNKMSVQVNGRTTFTDV